MFLAAAAADETLAMKLIVVDVLVSIHRASIESKRVKKTKEPDQAQAQLLPVEAEIQTFNSFFPKCRINNLEL